MAPRRRPVWPTVIGIISIALGGMGLACDSLGLIAQVVMRDLTAFTSTLAASQSPFAQPVPESFAYATASFEILVSVVLVIAGAQLLRRRRSGRTLHVVYCVGKVVQVVVGATIFIFMMHHVTSVASTMPTSGPASVGLKFGMLMGGIGGGLGMLFSLIYPIFLVIWFLRPAVKQELASWRGARS